MTALERVLEVLRAAGVRFAVIGASGMAVRGVVRSTLDVDLLTTDRRVLRRNFWEPLRNTGLEIEIRLGDILDPLLGVVTVSENGGRPVDIIVGEAPWQDRVVNEAIPGTVAGTTAPIATLLGLVLLKLYAGGPQDRWDIEQLLRRAEDREALEQEISTRVHALPARARRLWEELEGLH
ncbi:MAG: hypothetical protein GXP47_14905 [Acidobacteria bacterium]|nr:hypothetical protein [Acidobacteriota bacterium]